MIDIEAFLHEIHSSASPNGAFAVLEKYLAKLGLDRVVYSLMTDFRSLGLASGHAILGNYPTGWMEYYASRNYETIDPVRKLLMLTDAPFYWRDLTKYIELTKPESHLMEEAVDAELFDGIGLGIHGPRGETVGMGFASSSGGVDKHPYILSLVRLMAGEFHAVFQKFYQHNRRLHSFVLSRREREILTWIARGKKVPEIVIILSSESSTISEATIRTHVRNLQAKLEVTSLTQAVLKALVAGEINLVDINDHL